MESEKINRTGDNCVLLKQNSTSSEWRKRKSGRQFCKAGRSALMTHTELWDDFVSEQKLLVLVSLYSLQR